VASEFPPPDSGVPIEREPATMSVRSAAVWAMGSQYVAFAIQFATSVVISRFFLLPEEVGLFSIALAASLIVAVLQDFGLSRYISGLPSLSAEEVQRASSVSLLFSILIAGIIAALAWPMAWAYGLPGLAPLLLVIGASYLFMPLSIVPMALMSRRLQFRGHFTVNVGGALVQAATAIVLAAMGFSAMSLAWAAIGLTLSRGIIAQCFDRALPFPLRLDGLGPVMSFGGKASTLYISGALGTRTPDLIVGKLLTLAATGLYSRAYSLADQFRMLIAGAIGSVFYPAFARIRDRGEPLGPAYLRVCAGYSAIIWPGMLGLALASEPVIRLLYGEAWLGVAPLLVWIALAEILIISLPLHTDLPILMERMDRLIPINILDTLMSISFLAVGCMWGVEGAALSRLAYGVCWLFLYARLLHDVVKFDIGQLLRIYLQSTLASAAALAPLALTYAFISGPSEIGFFMLVTATLAGGLCWFASLFLMRHPAFEEIIGMASALPWPQKLRPILFR